MTEQLQISPGPRTRGVVKSYSKYNGWGFIRGDDSKDYFVHYSRIQMDGYRYLTPKEAVEFDAKVIGTKLQAHSVSRVGLTEKSQAISSIAPAPRKLRRNPFTPQDPIVDPNKFSGREETLARAVKRLYDRQNMIVSGDRGVGKSSFANQLCSFMAGDASLLQKLDIAQAADLPRHLIVRHICQRETVATDFFAGIITACETALGGIEKGSKLEVGLNYLIKLKRSIDYEKPKLADAAAYVASVIRLLLENNPGRNGVTLRIDEIDLVAAVEDVPGFLRSISEDLGSRAPASFNMILVGITGTLTSLISGHRSTARLFNTFHLPKMSDVEVRDVILANLSRAGVSIGEDVLERIVHLSDGFPSPAHLLGYHTFDYDTNSRLERDDLEAALEYLVKDFKVEEFAGLYDRVTAAEYSPIIAALADPDVTAMSSQQIASKIRESAEVVRGRLGYMRSKDVADLTKDGLWRLRDPLFKIYCRWIVSRG